MVFDSAGNVEISHAGYAGLNADAPLVSLESVRLGDDVELWLMQVPAQFDINSLNTKKVKIPSGKKHVEISDKQGEKFILKAGDPLLASQIHAVFPSKRANHMVVGPKFDRFLKVTGTVASIDDVADDSDHEVKIGKPLTKTSRAKLSAPTGLQVRFKPTGLDTLGSTSKTTLESIATTPRSAKKSEKSAKKDKKRKKKRDRSELIGDNSSTPASAKELKKKARRKE